MDTKDLKNRFTYHAPKGNQTTLYQMLRQEGLALAYSIDNACPEGREKALAITKLEEAIFWANAAIARAGNKEE